MNSTVKTLIAALILLSAAYSATAATWDTDFKWNNNHQGRYYVYGGEAHLTGYAEVTPQKHIVGNFVLHRCNGDAGVWDDFTGNQIYVRVPNTNLLQDYIIQNPTVSVTGDMISISFDQEASRLGALTSDVWYVRFDLLVLEGSTTPGCSGCSVLWLPTDRTFGPYEDCNFYGPRVRDLAASPNELAYDSLSAVGVSCSVTDDTGVLSVDGEISIPGDGTQQVSMVPASVGPTGNGTYEYTIPESQMEVWNDSGYWGVYWFRVIAEDVDGNVNDWVRTSFNLTTPPDVTTTTSTTTTTIPQPIPDSINVTFEYFEVERDVIQWCELWTNISGSWGVDKLSYEVENLSINRFIRYYVPNGTYIWNVRCKTDTNYTFIAEQPWLFHVCIGCEPCYQVCRGNGFDYGICRSDDSCLDYESLGGGVCTSGELCCCGNVQTTTTTTVTTTTLFTATTMTIPQVCGDTFIMEPEECDPPRFDSPECMAAGFQNCDLDCICTNSPITTSTTSTPTTTPPTTSTTTTTSTTSTSTTTTSSTSTTTLEVSWSTGFTWNQNHQGSTYVEGGEANMVGIVSVTGDKHIVGSFELNRCSGNPDLWDDFTGNSIYIRIPNTNLFQDFILFSPTVTVNDDTITISFDEAAHTSRIGDITSDVWYVRFDLLLMEGTTTPGCSGCSTIWMPSNYDEPMCN